MKERTAQPLTPERLKGRADRVRAVLADRFGHHVTDEESAEMRRKMHEATAARRSSPVEAEPFR
ncbi:hypothetical protein [Streptomyces sp. NPDC002845]